MRWLEWLWEQSYHRGQDYNYQQCAATETTAPLHLYLEPIRITYIEGFRTPNIPVIRIGSYDLAGNRTSVTLNGGTPGTFSYNFANQPTNSGYSYDAAGNLAADGATTYTYDALSRMTQRGSTTYTYNGDGTLVKQIAGGTTTLYTQDLASPLTQILQTKVGSATPTDYLYGLNRLASQSGSTTTWYANDALGSVRRTFNTAATPLGIVTYDPWGTPESGSVPTFGFTGELQDTAPGW